MGLLKKLFYVDPDVYFQKGMMAELKGNYTKAAFIYEIASNDGHAEAKFNLAMLYEAGRGVNQDFDLAEKLIREAANLGFSEANRWVDDIYDA